MQRPDVALGGSSSALFESMVLTHTVRSIAHVQLYEHRAFFTEGGGLFRTERIALMAS